MSLSRRFGNSENCALAIVKRAGSTAWCGVTHHDGGTNVFTRIMTPVDLAHAERMERSLQCGAELAALWGIPVVYVGVTAQTPGSVAHNPEEYGRKLAAFAAAQAEARGITAEAQAVVSHDPSTDLDDTLLKAVKDTGADLVVMASHVPGLTDYVWPSNGGKIAGHAAVSVMVVRG